MKEITVLFPGFFEPFHKGHESLLKEAVSFTKAKKAVLLLLDSKRKEERREYASLGLLKLRKENPSLSLSVVTENREGHYEELFTEEVLSYSYAHPEEKVYVMLGYNRFEQFAAFKQAEKIAKRCSFLVARYPQKEVDAVLLNKFDATLLNCPLIPYTSAQLREGSIYPLELNEGYRIANKQDYFLKEVASHEKPHRYSHSLSVAKTAYEIALLNGLDPQKAFLAGLLHDSGKDYPIEEQRSLTNQYFASFEPVKDFALHQFVSAYLAKEIYGVKDPEILEAIQYHCTGKGDMSPMQKCIYAADKVEPTRQFPTRKGRLACYRNLDQGFKVVLEEQKNYFLAHSVAYKEEKLSKEMYHYYLGED